MNKLVNLLIFSILSLKSNCQSPSEIKITDDIRLIKLGENAYQYEAMGANGMVVKTFKGTVLINTPWNDSLSQVIHRWIADSLKSEVVAVIATHSHNDCAGGLGYFNAQHVKTYGLESTCKILERQNLAGPEFCFVDSLNISIGKCTFECFFPGEGHAPDNIVVWIPSDSVLFGGCLVKPIKNKGLGNTADANLENWPKAVNNVLLKYPDAKTVVPGHGPAGGIELLWHTIKLF